METWHRGQQFTQLSLPPLPRNKARSPGAINRLYWLLRQSHRCQRDDKTAPRNGLQPRMQPPTPTASERQDETLPTEPSFEQGPRADTGTSLKPTWRRDGVTEACPLPACKEASQELLTATVQTGLALWTLGAANLALNRAENLQAVETA